MFKEAGRVLRPGGVLSMQEQLTARITNRSNFKRPIDLAKFIEKSLEDAGFRDIEITTPKTRVKRGVDLCHYEPDSLSIFARK